MRISIAILVLFVPLLCFSSDWTIAIYMNADNNLEPYALANILEMESVGSNDRVNVIVQLDGKNQPGVRRYRITRNPDNTDFNYGELELLVSNPDRALEIKPTSELLEILPELDSGNIQVFTDFLGFVKNNYPAEHNMVIIWGHGQGWAANTETKDSATPPDMKTGGISFDQTSRTHLVTSDVFRAISEIYGKIDIYGSDACLMQMSEVAYELKDTARFIIGSAERIKFGGWPYRYLLLYLNKLLSNGDQDTAFSLANTFPRLFVKSYYDYGPKGGDPIGTMSSINTEELGLRFAPALDYFAENFLSFAQESDENLRLARFVAENTLKYQDTASDLYYFSALLLQLMRENHIVPDWKLEDAIFNLQQTIDLISTAHKTGQDYQTLPIRGLSIWLPKNSYYYKANKRIFESSGLYREAPNWSKLLTALYSSDPDPYVLDIDLQTHP